MASPVESTELDIWGNDPDRIVDALYGSAISCSRAACSSARIDLLTVGYWRLSEANVSITAAATTRRVNHLLSAGTTYQGERLLAVWRTMAS